MTIKGILFDAADVFYYRPLPTDRFVEGLIRDRGLPAQLSAEDQQRQKELRYQANTGRVSPEQYWDQFLLLHGVAAPEERTALVQRIVAYSDNVLPIPGGHEAMAGLKQRGFVLGIVTDTIYSLERKMSWLDKVGVAEFVDVVACSTVLGAHKPDPAIYLNALEQARLAPAEAAFVGHDAGELEGARRAGLATVAVNHDPHAQADFYAKSLLDLLNVPILAQSHAQEVEKMTQPIKAIFVDVGNTLRILFKDEAYQARAKQQITDLVGIQRSPEEFCEELDARYKVYRKWAFETLLEAPERELWTRWLLPDCPAEQIAPLAGELTYLYRQTMGYRRAVPDAYDVSVELTRRGYKMGIISNTITEREIPEWLEADGLKPYYPTVVLSSILGHRKPGTEIFLEAARLAGVEPAECAYVADNPSRDVIGSRRSGFGLVILLLDPAELATKDLTGEYEPDMVIHTMSELLEIFPERQLAPAGA